MEQSSFLSRAKSSARSIKRDVFALWLAARDPRVSWYAKALAAIVAAYALSPIDLIPDFIPILGYLDDLMLVPLGIMAAVKLIAPGVMKDLRTQALDKGKPKSTVGLVIVATLWLAGIFLTAWFVWPDAARWWAGR